MLQLDAGIGASRGDAVLALLERAQVPPVPPFYKLCYDYLAGVRTLDTIRAGAIIEAETARPEGAQTAGELLYQDFVAPYRNEGSITQVVTSMIERISVLEKLIGQSQEANRSQAAERGQFVLASGEDFQRLVEFGRQRFIGAAKRRVGGLEPRDPVA